MAITLYLTSTATAAPFPTTSRLLSTTPNASEVTLGPGEFDQGIPGSTDAGQWNPSSPLGNTTLAAEIDNTGASPGTTRQGWLWDVDLTGKTLLTGIYNVQLRLAALQGAGTSGRMLMRVTVVTGSAGAYTTIANLLTTAITGETSHSTGQEGWRAQQDAARITVNAGAANFTGAIAIAGTSTAHTFASGERLLFELGFGDANSATDRTWQLLFNTSNSFITIPDILFDVSLGTDSIAVTDSLTAELIAGAIERTMSDSVSVTDQITETATFERAASDAVSVTDQLAETATFERVASDSTSVTDQLQAATSYVREMSDSVSVTDSITAEIAGAAIERTASDSVSVTDQLTETATFERSMSDSVSVTDGVAETSTFERSATDIVSVTDQVQREASLGRVLSDSITVTESLTITRQRDEVLSDTITVSDGLGVAAEYERILSDTIGVTDSITAEIAGQIVVEMSDSISVTDSITIELIEGPHPQPPVPPKPPKPKPRPKPAAPQYQTRSGGGGGVVVGGALPFVKEYLEEQARRAEQSSAIVVPAGPEWAPPAAPFPRQAPEQPDPRVFAYVNTIDSRQQFIEQDQRVQNITYNLGEVQDAPSKAASLLLVLAGFSLMAILVAAVVSATRDATLYDPDRDD